MRFSSKAVAAVVSISALAMSNLPTGIAQTAEQAFNGKDTCISIDSNGNIVAPQPGDCTQFGKGGQGNSDAEARNVIFILGDGMGHQEITAARNYLKGANGRFEGLDELTASGAYTTFAIGKDGKRQYVTDSAASATGWSTGAKTYNGALSVDITGKPHENLLEMAKNAGMRTGNVSTAEIQDATPGAMHSHISQRGYYAPSGEKKVVQGDEARENGGLGSISEQIIDTRADVTLGGGRKYFDTKVVEGGENRNPFLTVKNDGGADWEADKTVRENAIAKGYTVVDDKAGLDGITKADQDNPVLGLFNDGNMARKFERTVPVKSDGTTEPEVCKEADRGNEPSAAEMTKKAIELLDDPSADKGFFLQVESASIDKADHDADACGMIGETEQIDEVIKEALDFAKADGNTMIVVTADHAHTAEIIPDGRPSVSAVTRLKTPKDGATMSVGFGTIPWMDKDGNLTYDAKQNGDPFDTPNFSMMHTGTQVRIAGFGPGSENVNGQLDQTDAFYVMANALGLNGGTEGGQKPWKINKDNKVVSLANRSKAKPGDQLCYLVAAGEAPKVGDCAQFGKDGQGIDNAKAKNVVVLIGDGTGDSEITAARNYLKGSAGRFEGLDNLDYTGYLTTFSLDKETGLPNYVADSAATGTAWNSGVKSYNGAIGVDNAGKPVATMGELAKARGMKIGNVSTAEIQDATPAAFAAHALDRSYYAPSGDKKVAQGDQLRENGGLGSISEQIVDLRADVTLGGGRSYFNTEVKQGGQWGENGNTWTAGKTVLENAKDNGYQVVTNASELDAIAEANADKPVLGLFSEGNMPRVLNQTIPTTDGGDVDAATCEANPEFTAETPRLGAMTTKALELLKNDNGFLLQVESASPDKADHQADACGLIGEVGQLDEAVQAVQKWVEETGEETLIVATADHAHTAQITYDNANTAGRVTQLTTVEGSTMAVNFATSKTNEDEDALGGQQHTGAQLRVAASGPGAANVTGQIDQTDLFFLVNNALGIESINHGLTFENKMKPVEATTDEQPSQSSAGSSLSNVGLIAVLAISGIVGLLSLLALLFPFPVDEVLGPIAKR
ncbi:alkaline phosphatase [Corynebacterium sp. HMSC05H05]|uniref:alkaline phosphatase n=1 Tax=Corynebacterium sp. HMSC05H05 TaxID=1581119 RepID=UPI0008A17509|nr:alkaline phosphatase [Corynebacterium sp. HMSC05H05]OFT57742.1 alkaline phosphatase [Corynebacterium sp. HMSC05H05]